MAGWGTVMSNELSARKEMALQALGNMELNPAFFDDEPSLKNYTKLPLSRLPALGTAFEQSDPEGRYYRYQ